MYKLVEESRVVCTESRSAHFTVGRSYTIIDRVIVGDLRRDFFVGNRGMSQVDAINRELGDKSWGAKFKEV